MPKRNTPHCGIKKKRKKNNENNTGSRAQPNTATADCVDISPSAPDVKNK